MLNHEINAYRLPWKNDFLVGDTKQQGRMYYPLPFSFHQTQGYYRFVVLGPQPQLQLQQRNKYGSRSANHSTFGPPKEQKKK